MRDQQQDEPIGQPTRTSGAAAGARSGPRSGATSEATPGATTGVNEVRVRGRVSADPVERVLPSGARIIGFRVVVERAPTVMTRGSQQRSDWIECTAWSAQHRRRVAQWVAGDVVEVGGALRRRHYRTPTGGSSVVEIEMLSGRRLRRVGDATGP